MKAVRQFMFFGRNALMPHNIAKAHSKNIDDFVESVGTSMSRPDPDTVPTELVWGTNELDRWCKC